ncbi:MAG: prepilin peptidase [Eubacterium sp.]|nr:prepilin peptidase [Eubacterium sp.]
MERIKIILLLTVLLFAAADDCRRAKISNSIILLGIMSSGYLRCFLLNESIPSFLADLILPTVILFGFYIAGGLGAGDLKLISVVGSFVGFEITLYVIFFAGIFALLLSGVFKITGRKYSRIRLALPIMIGTFIGAVFM